MINYCALDSNERFELTLFKFYVLRRKGKLISNLFARGFVKLWILLAKASVSVLSVLEGRVQSDENRFMCSLNKEPLNFIKNELNFLENYFCVEFNCFLNLF